MTHVVPYHVYGTGGIPKRKQANLVAFDQIKLYTNVFDDYEHLNVGNRCRALKGRATLQTS